MDVHLRVRPETRYERYVIGRSDRSLMKSRLSGDDKAEYGLSTAFTTERTVVPTT